MVQYVLPFVAALIAGALNAVGGGGSFFTVPTLLIVGLDARIANATSTVALWPGSIASVGAYRRELQQQGGLVRLLAGISLIGGLIGALLLLKTPSNVFKAMLPYLLLVATILFALSPRINRYVRRDQASNAPSTRGQRVWVIFLQLIISIYGGFFGGGIGILMLATLGLMGLTNIHEMNAVKTVLAMLINGIAVVTFVVAHLVNWPVALLMAVAAIVGGYGGAAFARRIKPAYVRSFVIATGFVMSLYLFLGT
ncbi:MAG: sulfite exporter TauE/SafE family protein [Herpetosiphonaceae bacterium]|nr:sulfite exporter TauE/SafE family protein [Herpetosiphonaceae bacterium]